MGTCSHSRDRAQVSVYVPFVFNCSKYVDHYQMGKALPGRSDSGGAYCALGGSHRQMGNPSLICGITSVDSWIRIPSIHSNVHRPLATTERIGLFLLVLIAVCPCRLICNPYVSLTMMYSEGVTHLMSRRTCWPYQPLPCHDLFYFPSKTSQQTNTT